MSKPFVVILMGFDSGLFCDSENFYIPFEAKASSAHRTPEATVAIAKDYPLQTKLVYG